MGAIHAFFEERKCVGGEVTEVTNRVDVSWNEVLVEPCCCTMVIWEIWEMWEI